ncbi:MAG TPA: hypothetical protein VLW85_15170, partial [Myxococcales bacterium]|nr:hypothetical protein [Myxococcales bacterium]
LLVLDEPTDGLDPIGRALVRRVLREELARGRTVFLNSHLLSETERVCTRVGILHRGQLVREQAISAPAADGAGPSAVTLAGGETKLVEHADFAALNTHLDTLRAGGALISEVQRVGRDLEASLEQAVTGPGVVPPDPGPRPPEAPPARVQPLRAARATVRVAQEIAADLASRKVGWFGLGLAVLVLALFFWGLRNDIVGGAAAAVRQFGGPGGVADATTVAHFVGRWSASFVYWALLPGTLVFASLFAPPLLDPRRTVLLLAQPVSRGDLACALYATVCLATLAEYAFLVGLFFGGMRWLGVAVSPLFLALAAPLVLAFASLYAVSLAAAYGLRSGVASGGIAFGLFLAAVLSQAEMRAGGAPLRQIIGGTVLPRVVALGEQAARLGGGEAPRFAPFALTAAMATALFIVAFVIARRSEQ